MNLRKYKMKNGDISISIAQSFRRKDGSGSTKTVKKLGFLSKLMDEWNLDEQQTLDKCQQICDDLTKQYEQNQIKPSIDICVDERVDKRSANEKNFGSCVINAFYNMLNIETTIRNHTSKTKHEFNVCSAIKLLINERLLNPASRLSAYQNKDSYFFKCDFSLKNLYTSLDVLCECEDKIITSINKAIRDNGYRDECEKIFYDVTNYYFECDETDMIRNGCGKEHRPNPIIQMGLLQDANAIPITYNLFSGNTTDCLTLLPTLTDLKEKENLDRVIVVADKGNNTSTNIAACVARGDGFVFSQSIRGTKSKQALRDWVTNEADYRNKGDNFKIKSKIDTKLITIQGKDTYDGKTKKEKIEVKVVAFWSKKYEVRARRDRQKTLEKAREMIAHPSKFISACNFGAAKYVGNLDYNKETGEVIQTGKALYFDKNKLEEEEKCDGYYCIVTSETDMSDDEIIETYQGLWQIEETFKITKSDLNTRPVFVRTDKHIQAHFLICYIALVISRLIQNSLCDRPSVASIKEDLSKCRCSYADKNYWLFSHRTDLTDELYSLIGLEAQKKWMCLQDIKKWFGRKIYPKAKR